MHTSEINFKGKKSTSIIKQFFKQNLKQLRKTVVPPPKRKREWVRLHSSPANEKDEINNGPAAGAAFSFSPRARFPFSFLAPATQAKADPEGTNF